MTPEQMCMLSQMAYVDTPWADPSGKTIGQLASWYLEKDGAGNYIRLSTMDGNGRLDAGQWEDIFRAAQTDSTCSSLVIRDRVNNPEGDGLTALCLEDPSNPGKAIFAFRGSEDIITNPNDWQDNIEGGFGVSTTQQRAAAEYVNSVMGNSEFGFTSFAATGHSKGGNLAQFVTIVCPGATACASFDAQGFSPEFMIRYAREIAARGSLITRFVGDKDGVHHLLYAIPGSREIVIGKGDNGEDLGHRYYDFLVYNDDGTVRMKDEAPESFGWSVVENAAAVLLPFIPDPVGNWLAHYGVELYLDIDAHGWREALDRRFGRFAPAVLFGAVLIGLFVGVPALIIGLVWEVLERLPEWLNEAAEWIFDRARQLGVWVKGKLDALRNKFREFVADTWSAIKGAWERIRAGAQAAAGAIVASVRELDDIVALLRSAQNDLGHADKVLSSMLTAVSLEELPGLVWADWRTGRSLRVGAAAAYVRQVADSLRSTERHINALASRIGA